MAPTVEVFGTPEQQERFIPAFLRTDVLCCQLSSVGRVRGVISVEGREVAVEPEAWWGERDHSWGLRPLPRVDGNPPAERPGWRFLLFLPLQFETSAPRGRRAWRRRCATCWPTCTDSTRLTLPIMAKPEGTPVSGPYRPTRRRSRPDAGNGRRGTPPATNPNRSWPTPHCG